jgi:acetyl-CoA carboxylase biotin carboxylase subunit
VQGDLQLRGHAIEVRVYAEDPENNFFPSPGKITRLLTPSGPGIREDSGIYEGWTVPIDYDPMLSKVIAYAPTREQAIRRLQRALDEYFIGGIANNLGLFRTILENEDFRLANIDTDYLDRMLRVPVKTASMTNGTGERIAAIAAALVQSANGKAASQNGTNFTAQSINSKAKRWKSIARTEAMRDR